MRAADMLELPAHMDPVYFPCPWLWLEGWLSRRPHLACLPPLKWRQRDATGLWRGRRPSPYPQGHREVACPVPLFATAPAGLKVSFLLGASAGRGWAVAHSALGPLSQLDDALGTS